MKSVSGALFNKRAVELLYNCRYWVLLIVRVNVGYLKVRVVEIARKTDRLRKICMIRIGRDC